MSRTRKQRRDARKKRNRGAPKPRRHSLPAEPASSLLAEPHAAPPTADPQRVERNVEEDLRRIKANRFYEDVEEFLHEYLYDDWDRHPSPAVVVDPALLEALIRDVLARESAYLAHRDRNGAA